MKNCKKIFFRGKNKQLFTRVNMRERVRPNIWKEAELKIIFISRDRCCDFQNIFAEKFGGKKFAFPPFFSSLCKNWTVSLGLMKNANIPAKNVRKLPKRAIICNIDVRFDKVAKASKTWFLHCWIYLTYVGMWTMYVGNSLFWLRNLNNALLFFAPFSSLWNAGRQ
jgi:hypothetical protein